MAKNQGKFIHTALGFVTTAALLTCFACGKKSSDPSVNFAPSTGSAPLPSGRSQSHSLPRLPSLPLFHAPIFGEFGGSEAESFAHFHQVRLGRGNHDDLDEVQISGRIVDISRVPPAYLPGFSVHDHAIATRLGVPVGTTFTQTEVQNNLSDDQQDLIFDHVDGVRVVQTQDAEFNPIYDQRNTDPRHQVYIDFLRGTLIGRIRELNARTAGGYYRNPQHGTAYNGVNVRINPYDRDIFVMIMEAIRTNDEARFMQNIADFATSFHHTLVESKSASIDIFTYLFVTKRFPSEGVRNRYFHYAVKCGGIR